MDITVSKQEYYSTVEHLENITDKLRDELNRTKGKTLKEHENMSNLLELVQELITLRNEMLSISGVDINEEDIYNKDTVSDRNIELGDDS